MPVGWVAATRVRAVVDSDCCRQLMVGGHAAGTTAGLADAEMLCVLAPNGKLLIPFPVGYRWRGQQSLPEATRSPMASSAKTPSPLERSMRRWQMDRWCVSARNGNGQVSGVESKGKCRSSRKRKVKESSTTKLRRVREACGKRAPVWPPPFVDSIAGVNWISIGVRTGNVISRVAALGFATRGFPEMR